MKAQLCTIVGVGPGLGLALAHRFGCGGYRIAMLARGAKALQHYEKVLVEVGVEAHGFTADAARPDGLVQTLAHIEQSLGSPEVLIYNVAVERISYPLAVTEAAFVEDFNVNVASAFACIRYVAPQMRSQQRGTILLTGCKWVFQPQPQMITLSVGKAALRNLCFGLAKQLWREDVHIAMVTICGDIAPGGKFDPAKIAEAYWQVHRQGRGQWRNEYLYQ